MELDLIKTLLSTFILKGFLGLSAVNLLDENHRICERFNVFIITKRIVSYYRAHINIVYL